MSKSVRDLMESLPNYFLPEKAKGANVLIQFDFGADGNGLWVLELIDGALEPPREEEAASSDVRLTMAGSDFVAMYENRLNPIQAFMGGKIKASGNVGSLMQMMNWFDRG
jgi:putative sterol carrier protein